MKRYLFLSLLLAALLAPVTTEACDGLSPVLIHGRPWAQVTEAGGVTTVDLMATLDVCWPAVYDLRIYAYSPFLHDELPGGEIVFWEATRDVHRTGHHQIHRHATFETPAVPYRISIHVGTAEGVALPALWPYTSSWGTGMPVWESDGFMSYDAPAVEAGQ